MSHVTPFASASLETVIVPSTNSTFELIFFDNALLTVVSAHFILYVPSAQLLSTANSSEMTVLPSFAATAAEPGFPKRKVLFATLALIAAS